jgi:hypothetical protein
MWQELVVGVVVLAAAVYASWALMPAAARLRLARGVLRWSEGRTAVRWLRSAALAIESRAQKKPGGCGDCAGAASVRREESRE